MVVVKKSVKNYLNKKTTLTSVKLINRIKKYDNISFDIFETLVRRNVAEPKDVFQLVAIRYNLISTIKIDPSQFQQDRIRAYKSALSDAEISNIDEISLENIYFHLKGKYKDIETIKEIEIETEIDLCHADPTLKKVYDWCLNNGKNIYFVSDMYLGISVIKDILEKCGYNQYNKLYVSSNENKKKSTGTLFEFVLFENNISSKNIIHIGDNIRSDYIQAKKKHICSVLIANQPDRTKFTRSTTYSAQDSKLRSIKSIMNGFIDTSWNCYFQYGYEVLGPLLLGYSKWLHESAQKNNIEKLLFLSRDGMLLQKAYNLTYKSEVICNDYLYISRNSVTRLLIWKNSNLSAMLRGSSRKNWSCKTLCNRLGIDLRRGEEEWKKCGLADNARYTTSGLITDENVNKFYDIFKSEIIQSSSEQFNIIWKYLDAEFGENTGIVDIGWAGTIQNAIAEIFEERKENKGIKGFYLSTNKTLITKIDVDEFIPQSENVAIYTGGLIEFPFTSHEGSTNAYSMDGEIVKPILKENEYHVLGSDRELNIVDKIQEGALQFVSDFRVSKDLYDISWETAYYNLKMFSKSPRRKDVELFGDLLFYNDDFIELANPNKIRHYLVYPKELVKDFRKTGWKHGFLRKLLMIPLPYDRIITFMSEVNKE